LENAITEIKEAAIVKTMKISFDFGTAYELSDYKELVQKFEGLDVGMLILNAGIMSRGEWKNIDGNELDRTLHVNAVHPMYLMKTMLPMMLSR